MSLTNTIHVMMGGFDDGRTPAVQQYDVESRVYVCRLWRRKNEPYCMTQDAIVGAVYRYRGCPGSKEYETEVLDASTVRVTIPAEAMQRAGAVDMQLVIHQDGGELRSPMIGFMALESLTRGDSMTDEPALLLVALVDEVRQALSYVVGKHPYIGENGDWYVYSQETGRFEDSGVYSGGRAPYIGANGNWYIGSEDTGVYSGGMAPYIGANGHWYVGETDTGTSAQGEPGTDGVTPSITFEVETGPAGSDVEMEQTGTSGSIVLKLTIPRGDTGAVEGVDYYEGTPKALGTAAAGTANGLARGDHVHPMPTAAQLGVLPAGGTAQNALQLGGKDRQYFDHQPNLLDNSDFTRPVNQRGLEQYNGSVYSIDRWRGMSRTKIQIAAAGINLSNLNPTVGNAYWQQSIAPERINVGGFVVSNDVFTVAAVYDGTVPRQTMVASGKLLDGFVAQGENISLRVFYSADHQAYVCRFTIPSGYTDVIKIYSVALYKGEYTAETLPMYRPERDSVKLQDCMKYFHLYASDEWRPKNGLDASPPMRLQNPTQGTLEIGGVDFFFNSADL